MAGRDWHFFPLLAEAATRRPDFLGHWPLAANKAVALALETFSLDLLAGAPLFLAVLLLPPLLAAASPFLSADLALAAEWVCPLLLLAAGLDAAATPPNMLAWTGAAAASLVSVLLFLA